MKTHLPAFLASAALALFAVSSPAADVDVTINPAAPISYPFSGYFGQWGPGAFFPSSTVTDTDWTTELRRLDYLRTPRIRMFIGFQWFLPGGSAYGTPDWNTTEMQSIYRYLDHCQARGIEVMLVNSYDTSLLSDLTTYSDAQWAKLEADYLDHLRNTKGYTCIKMLNPVNESNHHEVYANYLTLQQNVHNELVSRGLESSVQIWGPDSGDGGNWVNNLALDQPSTTDGYASHYYFTTANGTLKTDVQGHRNTLNTRDPSKSYWLTEINFWDSANTSTHLFGVKSLEQALEGVQGGAGAVSVWQISDNNHWYGQNTWGLWKSKQSSSTMAFRPQFYVWSLLMRYAPTGSSMYNLTSTDANVRVLATQKNGEWSFYATNLNTTAKTAQFVVTGSSTVLDLARYDYTNTSDAYANYTQDAQGLPARAATLSGVNLGTGFTVTVPANGAVVLASRTAYEVGFWPFNENTGTSTADISGLGNNGTLNGGAAWTAGRSHKAILFDGVNDSVSVADSASLDLTNRLYLDVWVNFTAGAGSVLQKILGKDKGAAANVPYEVRVNSNAKIGLGLNGTWYESNTLSWSNGTWYRLQIAWDGSTVSFTRNGTAAGSVAASPTLAATTGTLYLGRGATGFEKWFNGKIDEVRLSDEP
jgi:hypothetical protein